VQRFKRTTAPLGGPIQVSLDEPGTVRVDFAPAVAFLADGSVLVAWERFGPQIGSSPVRPVRVMARRFKFRNGRPFGPPQTISDSLVEDGRVALCATRGGAIGAAWTSLDRVVPFLPSLHGAVFRRLTPNGQPFGSEVPLAAPSATVGGVALACSAASFTAVWRSDQQPANGQGIVARRIAVNGALGDTLSISEAADRVSPPAAFEDARGNTVVAWADDDGARAQVVFRRLDDSGALGATTPASVLPLAGSLQPPAVGGIGRAGDFVVVWSGSEGLLGRRFSAAGVPLAARAPAADLDAASTDER
jgi:hypothetical protein